MHRSSTPSGSCRDGRRQDDRHRDATALRATVLQIPPREFLNHLFRYSAISLVVRAPGLSLFRHTEFGLFHDHPSPTPGGLYDPVSDLHVAPDQVRRICFLADNSMPPCFEVEFFATGFSLALFPDDAGEDREVTEEILAACRVDPVPVEAIRARGGCQWLDEGLSEAGGDWTVHLSAHAGRPGIIQVDLSSTALALSCPLVPGGIDHCDHVWRLSDAAGDTVLHLEDHHPACDETDLAPLRARFSNNRFVHRSALFSQP